MKRTSIRLTLSILFNLAFASALIGLGGCSGGESPKPEAVQKVFSKRLANSGEAPTQKARLKEGPKQR
jgi:hypothetical protein